MRIDNSALKSAQTCLDMYRERYVVGIERDWSGTDRAGAYGFGKRAHLLLEQHFKAQKGEHLDIPPPEFPLVEDEVQTLIATYKAHYPTEDFDVIDVERTFEVPLPCNTAMWECMECGCGYPPGHVTANGLPVCPECGSINVRQYRRHTYSGKFDIIGRRHRDGQLIVLDHKTERRGSRDNDAESWAARSQGTYYLWAAAQLYSEQPACLVVDVLTRQSPAGRIPPTFRRDEIYRDNEQIAAAVRDLVWWADTIERCRSEFGPNQPWPQNRNNCIDGWKRCDFAPLHVTGRSDELVQIKYKEAERYLDL